MNAQYAAASGGGSGCCCWCLPKPLAFISPQGVLALPCTRCSSRGGSRLEYLAAVLQKHSRAACFLLQSSRQHPWTGMDAHTHAHGRASFVWVVVWWMMWRCCQSRGVTRLPDHAQCCSPPTLPAPHFTLSACERNIGDALHHRFARTHPTSHQPELPWPAFPRPYIPHNNRNAKLIVPDL